MAKKKDRSALIESLSKDSLWSYYQTHSITACAKYFNISTSNIEYLIRLYELKKTPEQIRESQKNTSLERYGVDNPAKSSDIRDKISQNANHGAESQLKRVSTLERKYGSIDEAYRIMTQKQKESLIANHGSLEAAYAAQQETRVKTFQRTLGVDNPFQSEDIKLKIKKTSQLRYSTDYPNQNEDVKRKIFQSSLAHHGPDNFNNWKKGQETRILNSGSLENSYRAGLEVQKQTMLERYGVECIFNSPDIKSHVHKRDSGPNKEFASLLRRYSIEFQQEFVLDNKSFDFKVGNVLIEINPTISHNVTFNPFDKNVNLSKTYHRIKSDIAEKHGYRCIHVWDWDDTNKILKLLLPRRRIYARNCDVKEITQSEAKTFIDENHLQNYAKDAIRIGLFHESTLVSVMTFGAPRYNKNYQYELIRYCSSINVIGGANKLFKYFINSYHPQSIISYCDTSKFSGNVYKQLGFKYKSCSLSSHWFNIKTRVHILDSLLRARGFDQLLGNTYGKFGKGSNNRELMIEHGFLEVIDSGQSVYEFTHDSGSARDYLN